jgi:hypothetical protein
VTAAAGAQPGVRRGGETNPKCLSGDAGEGAPSAAFGHPLSGAPSGACRPPPGVACVVFASGRGFTTHARTVREVGP